MPSNLELKAICPSISTARLIAKNLGATFGGILQQRDTYLNGASGRIKIREFGNSVGELIYYRRPDLCGNRYSNYDVEPVAQVVKLKRMLIGAFGVKIVVLKKRELYLFENARIHLDKVQDLGNFIEFEVMNQRGEKQTEQLMKFLRTQFGISEKDIICSSYSDLLLAKKG
ncbi:MAG: class IV adenylate cyclase [bacterium]